MKRLTDLLNFLKTEEFRTWHLSLIGATLLLPPAINSVLIILFFLHWFFLIPVKEKKEAFNRNKWQIVILTGFYFFNSLSCFFSENKSDALFDLEVKLSILFMPIIVLLQRPIVLVQLKKILSVFAFSIISFSLLAVIIGLIQKQSFLVNHELALVIGLHASYLSIFIVFSIFIFLEIIREKGIKPISVIFISIACLILVLLASRIILLALFALVLIWFFLIKANLKAGIFSLSLISILVIIAFNVPKVKERLVEAVNLDDKVILDAPIKEHKTLRRGFGGRAIRIAIWDCCLEPLKKHWLFGVGGGDVQDLLQDTYRSRNFEFASEYNRFNAHNLFIQTILSCGILGLILVLIHFIYLFYLAIKNKNLTAFSFISTFVFLSCVESTFNVQSGVVFFALFSTVLVSFLSHNFKDVSTT